MTDFGIDITSGYIDNQARRNLYKEIFKVIPFLADQEGDLINLHSARVAILSSRLGTHVLESDWKMLFLAGLFHDVGANGSSIHPVRARSISEHSRNPWLKTHTIRAHHALKRILLFRGAAQSVLEHHEWFDGGGYPLGKTGTNIMLEAQALRLADAFDIAMLYLGSAEAAFDNLRMRKDKEFDGDLLDLFKKIFSEMGAQRYWENPEETIKEVMDFYRNYDLRIGEEDIFSLLLLFDLKKKPLRSHTKRVKELAETACRIASVSECEDVIASVFVHEIYTTYEPYRGAFIGSCPRRDILDYFSEVQNAFLGLEEDLWVAEIVRACCSLDQKLSINGEPHDIKSIEQGLSEMASTFSADTLLLLEKAASSLKRSFFSKM